MNENSEISEAAQSAQSVTNTVVTPQSYVMTYIYDANNRMLTQKKAENGIDYLTKMGYDKNGNMTSRQRSSIGGPVGDNTNMEVSIGTMQSNPGSESVAETFSYNSLNQMVGYQNSNGTNASYAYDATGMRTSKTVNGVKKKFYYNGMYILNEGDSAETNVTNLVGMTRIEGRQNGADETAYFMKDAHGNAVKVLDSEDFLADYEYDIWGNQTQDTTNTFDNPFRYCSEYMGEESGLIYLRARYYDLNTGRFTQEDPAMSGSNWYIYGNNDPIQLFDPYGLEDLVISGSEYDGRYKYSFIEPAIKKIRELRADGRNVTWVISRTGYSEADIAKFTEVAKNNGANIVLIENSSELQNYINSKSTSSWYLSESRTSDKITKVAVFSHGVEGSVELGFSQTNSRSLKLDKNWIDGIFGDAFDNPNSAFYSCNTGTGGSGSFAQAWVNLTGGRTWAAVGTTWYEDINSGQDWSAAITRKVSGSFNPYGSPNYPVEYTGTYFKNFYRR